jgi:glycosyltransferase 2 family protein
MGDLRSYIDAVQAFGERLAAVDWTWLALAVALGFLNLALRSRAWQFILRAALPEERIRYRTAFGAYCAGVGVNAIIPARVGDLVKMYLVKRSAPSARYPVLVGSLVAETLFDMVVAGALIAWALTAGVLPGVRLPDIPAFEFSLALRHPWITLGVVVGLLILLLLLLGRIRAFWREFGRGLAIVRTPGRYLRQVALLQGLGWGCRVGAAACFLLAFHVPASLQNALVVQVAGSLAGLLPATPGGVGPKQALLVLMLAGVAGRTDVLAFSAGMDLTLVVANVVLGFTCLVFMVRSLRIRRTIARARADGEEAAPG